jgi:hypothetical protein
MAVTTAALALLGALSFRFPLAFLAFLILGLSLASLMDELRPTVSEATGTDVCFLR